MAPSTWGTMQRHALALKGSILFFAGLLWIHHSAGYIIHITFNINSLLVQKLTLCLSSDFQSNFTTWGLKSQCFLKGQFVGHRLRNGLQPSKSRFIPLFFFPKRDTQLFANSQAYAIVSLIQISTTPPVYFPLPIPHFSLSLRPNYTN